MDPRSFMIPQQQPGPAQPPPPSSNFSNPQHHQFSQFLGNMYVPQPAQQQAMPTSTTIISNSDTSIMNPLSLSSTPSSLDPTSFDSTASSSSSSSSQTLHSSSSMAMDVDASMSDVSMNSISAATLPSSSSSSLLSNNNSLLRTVPDLTPMRSTVGGINTEDWKLEDFELLETLGTGTFGRVRLCRNKKTQSYFAMKILKKKHIIRLKQVEHILNEKKILAHSDHSFVVRLYKTFMDEKNLYMIMEYVVGGEMFYHLRKAGKFPNDVAKFYAAEIVLAIEYLHRFDIVYRDLKPENLLLDDRGHIKLTDFGFAKVVHGFTYTLCGTPEYLAPEIIQSKGHNKAVDWWALGILIYEMLVGYPPFFDESPYRIYEKILAGRIEFPRFVDPQAKDLIKKLLALDRSKRFGNLKNGSEDIKRHKWFSMVDWDMLYQKRIDAPIPVQVSGSGDSRYYEDYQNSIEDQSGPGLTQEQQDYFKEF